MTDWIDVKDRLPPKDIIVLVYCKNMGCFLGWIDAEIWYPRENDLVTHWQPLPDPPKDGTNIKRAFGREDEGGRM